MLLDILSISLTLFGTGITVMHKDSIARFNTYKDKGLNCKQNGKVAKAVVFYRKALEYASSTDQKIEVWNYIVHCHTDRTIAAVQEKHNDTGDVDMFRSWDWGPTRIPSDYVRPPRKETLR